MVGAREVRDSCICYDQVALISDVMIYKAIYRAILMLST